MRIAFDGRPLLGRRTGVGVWLEGLIRALADATDWEFSLLLPRPASSTGVEDLGRRLHVSASPIPLPGTLWLHTLAGSQVERAGDVFVGTLGVLPRRLAVPGVLMVHDLTPVTRPHHHTLVNWFCFAAYFHESLAVADAVVCLSRATRSRLRSWHPGRASREAEVIGPGVEPFFSPPAEGESSAATRDRFAGGRPFVVQLGTLEPRKGVATLIEAHGRLVVSHEDGPDLVLAGGTGWHSEVVAAALARHPRRDRVHRPGYVTREEARDLFRHAEAVVVASEEEGFGLPVAEALACGAACVISDDPALLEAAADAAEVFPRSSVTALAEALSRTLESERQGELRARARTRRSELGWSGPARQWIHLLQRLTMPANAATGN